MSRKALVPVNVLAKASEPTGQYAGDLYFNTSDKITYTFDGTVWISPADNINLIDGGTSVSEFVVTIDGGSA